MFVKIDQIVSILIIGYQKVYNKKYLRNAVPQKLIL